MKSKNKRVRSAERREDNFFHSARKFKAFWRYPAFIILILPFSVELLIWYLADWFICPGLTDYFLAASLAVISLMIGMIFGRSLNKAAAVGFALVTFVVLWLEGTHLFDILVGSERRIHLLLSSGLSLLPSAAIAIGAGFLVLKALKKNVLRRILTLTSMMLIFIYILALNSRGVFGRENKYPNIILVVLDTTRADHLSVYGYPRQTCPGMEWLAQEAAIYEQAMSAASWTPPGHASILTGLLPSGHGTDGDYTVFDPPSLSLPEVLKKAGYKTGAIVNNPMLDPSFGWGRGFDNYRITWVRPRLSISQISWMVQRFHEDWPWFGSTRRTVSAARRWWSANGKRTRFLFLNLIDPHSPYGEAHGFKDMFLDDMTKNAPDLSNDSEVYDAGLERAEGPALDRVIARYDADIRHMDSCLQSFFRWLEDRNELDQTLLVFTSDHGERLGERGLLGHQLGLDLKLLHVPLIVRYPPKIPARRISKPVQTQGIYSTILETVGLEIRNTQLPVAASLDKQEFKVTFAQMRHQGEYLAILKTMNAGFDPSPFSGDWFSVSDGKWKLHQSNYGAIRLFDLVNDPAEEKNLAAVCSEEVKRLLPYFDILPRFDRGKKATTLSEELVDLLRSLGYIR